MSLLPGFATPEGTFRYQSRYQKQFPEGYFRERSGLWFSSIGIGSYLGEPDHETDTAYEEALKEALSSGINVVDSAINYRAQRSERSFGRAIAALIQSGIVRRDEIIVCTKAGFLPFDQAYPRDPSGYFRKAYIETGILNPEDIVQGCHAMSPSYLEDQLSRSLKNLGLETIDVYYLHNPETQLAEVDRAAFVERLRKAFKWCEEKVDSGKIRAYGTATWTGYRISPQDKDYLSLQEIVLIAREAGGPDHHFRFVQLPFNLAMSEAWITANQAYGANQVPLLGMAERVGVHVIGSASLLQAHLAGQLPAEFTSQFPNLRTAAQCSLQFARSVPGMTTSLVGMKNSIHVKENVEVARVPALSEGELFNLFQQK
ncbi:MAG TPA: aldo/keto reductase [bacterium]|nr:aldo/keto reductase [bacterium]